MKTVLLSWLVLSSVARGDSFFVDISGEFGDFQEEGAALTELVRTNVVELGHKLAQQPGDADYLLAPRLLRLGRAFIVSIEKRKNGEVVYSSKAKSASAEELDVISLKLTRSVIDEAPLETKVTEVTDAQAQRGMRRRGTRKLKYISFGPGGVGNLDADGVGYYLSAGYAWDAVEFLVRLKTDLTMKKGALFLDAGLGAQYFFTESDFAPFVGAEFGYGLARLNRGSLFSSETNGGFVIGTLVGFQMLRTSDINLEVALRYALMLASSPLGKPYTFGARIGLYF